MANKNGFKELEGKIHGMLRDFAVESGAHVLNFFKDSWKNQGFTDRSLERWALRKTPNLYRRASAKMGKKKTILKVNKAARKKILKDANRAILVGTQRHLRLKNSLRQSVKGLSIEIKTDKPYAQIHNEGGMAGRGRKTKIPQRQFMGESEILFKQLEDNFHQKMSETFNNLSSI